ncbi:hypothetical protein PFISCL1PPCAC_3776, partial [Pristionchus fissidentatus]
NRLNSAICLCNEELCNQNKSMYNVPLSGKGVCYLKTTDIETTTCWGDYCFWMNDNNRGCIDASGASVDFELRLGESVLDNEYLHICKGNYCNSDFQYPNGTIVGPSASRPHTSSLFPALPITSTLLLTTDYSSCTQSLCAADYCYAKKKINNQGCLTPREDVWANKTLPYCEKNRLNSVICLCN